MSKYSLGLDYGTLSVRALLVDVKDGREIATAEHVYEHGVFGEKEVCGKTSKATTALQHPQDYIDGFSKVVKEVLRLSGISAADVVGICLDFTSSTVLPTLADGTPLCFLEQFKRNPHAYVKLWKHHGAAEEAEKMTDIAKRLNRTWLETYGGKISSELMLPKIAETLNAAPDVYDCADKFLEAGDWLTFMITGQDVRSCCMAGYKALWDKKRGYPDAEFFEAVNPKMKNIIGSKISEKILPVGVKAGNLNAFAAKMTGLIEGTPVAVPIIDAHAATPAVGVKEEGNMLAILGTSAVYILLSKKDVEIKGICGKVIDGVVPGLVAYEAGQTGFGDCFDWITKNCLSENYLTDARAQNKNVYEYLNQKAEKLDVGQSGLIALDWWNGNRTPYADYHLGGAIIGMNLQTKPEEIYRAVVESVAFGTKRIVDVYIDGGLTVNKITAAGGIAGKNPFLMQVFADVLGIPVAIAESKQAGAKGSAIYAAAAGGAYQSIVDAASAMSDKINKVYYPNAINTQKYADIYAEYVKLSEYFAKENAVMKRLRNIKAAK